MITSVSVKVMRSYDYCHFEVAATATVPENSPCPEIIADDLRKMLARLADKAVKQYQIAKASASRDAMNQRKLDMLRAQNAKIMEKPESELTPEEKAVKKALSDRAFALRTYDYQDDWHGDEDNDGHGGN